MQGLANVEPEQKLVNTVAFCAKASIFMSRRQSVVINRNALPRPTSTDGGGIQ